MGLFFFSTATVWLLLNHNASLEDQWYESFVTRRDVVSPWAPNRKRNRFMSYRVNTGWNWCLGNAAYQKESGRVPTLTLCCLDVLMCLGHSCQVETLPSKSTTAEGPLCTCGFLFMFPVAHDETSLRGSPRLMTCGSVNTRAPSITFPAAWLVCSSLPCHNDWVFCCFK